MSNPATFGIGTDTFGIATADLILIDGAGTVNDPATIETTPDAHGDIACAASVDAVISSVARTYLVKGSLNLSTLALGVQGNDTIITGITVNTSGGQAQTIDVTGVVNSPTVTAPDGKKNSYTLPAITITGAWIAAPMGFTVTKGELISCTLSATLGYDTEPGAGGEPIAAGVSGASYTVDAEFGGNCTDKPTWTVTGDGTTVHVTASPANTWAEARGAFGRATGSYYGVIDRDAAGGGGA